MFRGSAYASSLFHTLRLMAVRQSGFGGMALSNIRTLFPGAMGPDGFISCFDHLIPRHQLRRRLILKGGPGVGKSTFMRRLHTELCTDGEPSVLCFCSGDPDSLDAVVLPDSGLLILDGTAPHSIDPEIPGARDSLINLGVCLDEAAMRSLTPLIQTCMRDHAAASRRARAYMKAASILEQDCAAIISDCLDRNRCSQMTSVLIQAVLCADAPREIAGVSPVITDAVTPKGKICLLSEDVYSRVIRLTGHPCMDLTPVLRRVSEAVCAAGWHVQEHLNPAIPGTLAHLSIPALSTLITTGGHIPAEQTYDFAACIPSASLLRSECALDQGQSCAEQMMQRAVSAMAQAKQIHDELETFYVPNMNFGAWQRIFDQTLADLKR